MLAFGVVQQGGQGSDRRLLVLEQLGQTRPNLRQNFRIGGGAGEMISPLKSLKLGDGLAKLGQSHPRSRVVRLRQLSDLLVVDITGKAIRLDADFQGVPVSGPIMVTRDFLDNLKKTRRTGKTECQRSLPPVG